MSDHNSHEWLSAFLDGEMTDGEQSAAEVRLRDDPVVRRELEQLREMRELLRSLPRHEPPNGFSAVVMQRCERESLLAESSESIAAATAAVVTPRVSRSAIAIAVSLVATAAMLFLLVQVVSPPGTPKQNRTENPEPFAKLQRTRTAAEAAKALAMDSADRQPSERAPITASARAGAAAQPQNSARSAAPSAATPEGLPGIEAAKAQNQKPLAAPFLLRGSRGGFGGGSAAGLEFGQRQSGIHIGEVVPYLQVAGDRTAVIEVTVVDVSRAVGRLEVLLERKLVQPLTKRDPRQQNLFKKGKASGNLLSMKPAADDKGQSELIAVYVESTQAQLSQVMRELDKETQSLHVSLRPPVALGDVRVKADSDVWADLFRRDRRRSPQTLADAAAFGREAIGAQSALKKDGNPEVSKVAAPSSNLKVGSKRDKRNVSPAKSSEPKDGGKQMADAPGGGKKSADPSAVEAAKAARSFQLRLKLSDQPTARDEQDRNDRKKFSRGNAVRSARRSARGGAANRKSAAPQPVQVIFVFRRQAPADQPVPARRPR